VNIISSLTADYVTQHSITEYLKCIATKQSTTYVGELALDCGDTGSIGDISRADFDATGSSCVAGIAACSNDWTSSALAQ